MDWRLVTEFFASVGYGLLSSFIPVFNSEVYIVAAQALGTTAEVTVAIGWPSVRRSARLFAVALLLGRCVLFLAVAFGASALIQRLFS
jgi:ABC-type microcin C transport system permease subunit YejB